MVRSIRSLGVCGGLLLLLADAAQAATIGYWRMEQDLDGGPGLLVANEVAGGSDLISTTACIDTNLPTTSVPNTGSPNVGSLGSTQQGSAAGINASAAAYGALNTSSITIEFWARTVENDAELFLRSTGNNGIIIDQPSSLRVRWWVDDGAGGAEQRQMAGLFDMNDAWNHFAFTYDHLSGIAEFFVDGVSVGTDSGTANRALVWDPSAAVEIGRRMDFAAANNGTIDEVRIDDNALGGFELLNSPEPGTGLLVSFGLIGLGLHRRARRRR